MTIDTLIPEWPKIDGARPALIGLKGGADHPFGALLIVATPLGLVVVHEYLARQQANITHKIAILQQFGTHRFTDLRWAVSETERELRMEFALAGIPTLGVPQARAAGIQRVQSWLAAHQLFVVGATCPQAIRQLQRYRYAENTLPDGQKRDRENVFRADDELPDALGVALLAWPDLPMIPQPGMTERERKRWESLDEGSRRDIERLRDYVASTTDLDETDPAFPVGDFFGSGRGSAPKLW
jgi:hypothetical protein